MKKKIVIGSILTVIILMILPSVSAVEFNTAVESNKAQILEQIRSMNIDELREKIKNLGLQELKEKLKNIGSNERMQLLQSFIKSSDTKNGIFGNIIKLIYIFVMSFITWVLYIPYMLRTYHMIIPFWLFVILWIATLLA